MSRSERWNTINEIKRRFHETTDPVNGAGPVVYVLLVDFPFGDHRAAFADRSIFSCDLFLRPHPFPGLIEVHSADGDLVVRRFQ